MNERLTTAGVSDPPSPALPALAAPGDVAARDVELDAAAALPAGHPLWQRDGVSISARVRAIVAALQPIAVRVLSFWDHVARSARIGTRTLEIDPSGSYRLR